jgi:hypothetical protein
MDRLVELVTRLNRLGYRTQTFGDEIIVEFDAASRFRGTWDEIERLLPVLSRGAKSASRRIAFSGTHKLQMPLVSDAKLSKRERPATSKVGKKKKRRATKTRKIKLKSAIFPTGSIETKAWARTSRFRKSRSQGGLPGLAKHR